jgi:hypothetical protein
MDNLQEFRRFSTEEELPTAGSDSSETDIEDLYGPNAGGKFGRQYYLHGEYFSPRLYNFVAESKKSIDTEDFESFLEDFSRGGPDLVVFAGGTCQGCGQPTNQGYCTESPWCPFYVGR